MSPNQAELEKWHTFFAKENNNRAWDLAAKSNRNAAESDDMLNAAHASAFHWGKVGTDLNVIRATMLLAEVHALVGQGKPSLRYAEKVTAYFKNNKADDWELALVHTIHAHAASVAGQNNIHVQRYRAAQIAIDAISDPEDRKIVLQTFNQVPVPGQDA